MEVLCTKFGYEKMIVDALVDVTGEDGEITHEMHKVEAKHETTLKHGHVGHMTGCRFYVVEDGVRVKLDIAGDPNFGDVAKQYAGLKVKVTADQLKQAFEAA